MEDLSVSVAMQSIISAVLRFSSFVSTQITRKMTTSMKQPKASFILGKVSTTKDCVMGIFLLLLFVRVVCLALTSCLVVPASSNMYMYYGRRLVSTGFQSCSEFSNHSWETVGNTSSTPQFIPVCYTPYLIYSPVFSSFGF